MIDGIKSWIHDQTGSTPEPPRMRTVSYDEFNNEWSVDQQQDAISESLYEGLVIQDSEILLFEHQCVNYKASKGQYWSTMGSLGNCATYIPSLEFGAVGGFAAQPCAEALGDAYELYTMKTQYEYYVTTSPLPDPYYCDRYR